MFWITSYIESENLKNRFEYLNFVIRVDVSIFDPVQLKVAILH